MKISNKFFFGALIAASIALVGCGMSEGDLDGKGSKWERTITKDSTKVGVEEASPAYGRAFSQLGTGEKVQSIKTLVTVYTDGMDGYAEDLGNGLYKVIETGTAEQAVHGVVGFMFDLHTSKAKEDNEGVWKKGDTLYDFVIVGYRPSDKGFYVERYANILEGSMDEFVSDGGFGKATDFITATKVAPYVYGYKNEVTSDVTEEGENIDQFTVTIEQDDANKGTYKIKIGGELVGSYVGTVKNDEGYAIGGAGVYVNAPIGTIVKASFESDKDATVGLFAEPVEE